MRASWGKARIGAIAISSAVLLAAMLAIAQPVPAQTISLHGNVAPDAIALSPVGHADPATVLTMGITLMPRNQAEVNALIAAQEDPKSAQYHKWLTTGEYARRFGPTEQDFNAVAAWLDASGFQITGGSQQEGIVRFSGSVATVEKAFNTKIMTFRDGSKFGNTTEPEIPASFAPIIGEVTGLQNLGRLEPAYKSGGIDGLPAARPSKISPPAAKLISDFSPAFSMTLVGGTGDTFAPPDFYTFYDENPLLNAGINGGPNPALPLAPSDCIGIFAQSNIFTDLLSFFTSDQNQIFFSIAPINLTIDTSAEGDPGVRKGSDAEAYLDIEWSHSVAPGDPIILYVSNPTAFTYEENLQDTLGTAVNQNKCGAINISFQAVCGQPASFFTSTLGTIFAKAQLQGQSVFVASGDDGVDMCNEGVPNVNELSANPLTTSVGGTGFTPEFDGNGNDAGSVSEFAWNDNNTSNAGQNSATGGGLSQVFTTKPAFQTGEGVPNDGVRDIPDVAMIASGEHPGVFVILDTDCTDPPSCTNPPADEANSTVIGGTSLAAPVWTGISRLIQERTGQRQGSLNPRIYQLANEGLAANGFRDVLTGDNTYIDCSISPPAGMSCPLDDETTVQGYSAGPGYDLVTGWGSVDIATFVDAYAPPPTPWPSFQHDSLRSGQSQYNNSTNTGSLRWSFPTPGDSALVNVSPVIDVNGIIYFSSNPGSQLQLFALNPNGTKEWEYTSATSDAPDGSPAISSDGSTIYFGAGAHLYAINTANGTLKWAFPVSGEVGGSPLVGPDGTIYIGADNELEAVSDGGQGTATLIWQFRGASETPALSADGSTIYIGSDAIFTGSVTTCGTAPNTYTCPVEKWSITSIELAQPSIGANGIIYYNNGGQIVSVTDNGEYCPAGSPPPFPMCNTTTGTPPTQNWAYSTGSDVLTALAIGANGTIYFGEQNGDLFALTDNGASATEKWAYATGNSVDTAPAVGGDGTIYVGNDNDDFFALTDGGPGDVTKKWEYATGGGGNISTSSSAIGGDGTVYFGAVNGFLGSSSAFYALGAPLPSPTPTATATKTATPTASATATPTLTATKTATISATPTATATATATSSATNTATVTNSATATSTPTPTNSATATNTATSSATATQSATATPTASPTATPTTSVSVSASLSFGNVAVGQTSTKTVTVTNTGRTNSLIVSAATPSDPEYALSGTGICGPLPVTLAHGTHCTLGISFSPSAVGPHPASLMVFDNATSSPQVVMLTGTGIAGLTTTKSSLVFGDVKFGAKGIEAFAVINHQSQPVTLSESFSGPNFPDFTVGGGTCTSTLDALKACSIIVYFRPSVLGTESATLAVSDSPDPLSPYTVALSTGNTIPDTVLPATLAYGTLTSHTPTKTKTVTVTNLSAFPLSLSENISGMNANDFAVTGGTCGASVPANSSCTIVVTFTPTGGGSPESGSMAVSIGSDPTSPHNISLTGTGP